MDDSEILRRRLRHHGITGPRFREPADTVRAFGAMQAQEFAMACWAVGLRTTGATESRVLAAFDAGKILRTHVLRPTWHFVAAEDLGWLMPLSAPRVHALNAYQYRQLGLDAATLRRGADLIVKALADGSPRTREELQLELARARLELHGPALAYVVIYAELESLVCSGPRRGKKFTYMRFDQRALSSPALPRTEALTRLAQRFFSTRGPATPQDFATWSSFPLRDVQAAIAGLDDSFARETRDGRTLIFPHRVPRARPGASATLLLPDYDEYGMSYRDRRALFPPDEGPPRSHAFNRMIVVQGRIAGSWRRTFTGTRMKVDLVFPRPVSAPNRRAVNAAIKKFTQFVGRANVDEPVE